MTSFLNSLKADLLDRRLLPLVAVVAVGLAAAVAYTVLGGGSSAAPTAALASGPATASSGIAISQTNPEKAIAETTSGASVQRGGKAHNPFTPLPEPKAKTATTSTASSTSSSSSSSSSSSGGSSPTTPATPATPAKPSKPATVYHVAVLFGELPAGATAQTAQLTPYENLKLLAPLPSVKQPLIVFRGVTAGGKTAIFTLVSEAILHGNATCRPNASQCEAIDLLPGQAEQLEYISATGQPVTYELRIVSIVSANASSAAVKNVLGDESKAGRELLRHAGLDTVPGLRYSAQQGVLVFAGHRAFGAHAHAAAHTRHRR
jgi:hypothetical protein